MTSMNWGILKCWCIFARIIHFHLFNLRAYSIASCSLYWGSLVFREYPQHVICLLHAKALRLQSQGGVRSQEWNLKKLTEWHHKTWSVRFNLTQHGELYQIRTGWGLTDWVFFLDFLNGGAWPLLVGGVICLVDSVNGRDPSCPVGFRIAHRIAISSAGFTQRWAAFRWLLLCGIPCFLHKVRFWATAGLWCSSMFWATRALQCQWEQEKWLLSDLLDQKSGETPESRRPTWDRGLQLLVAQRGMSRRRSSSNCADYVPAICTHRPSLFPMMVEYRWSDRRMLHLPESSPIFLQ